MAARLTSVTGRVVIVAALVGCASACGPPSGVGQGGPPATPQVTPQASYSASMAATVSIIDTALAGQGIRVAAPVVPYRPAEPASLAAAARVILQADVQDPGAGYVGIYELRDTASAAARGAEFADYLESGFGQTNYPLDAQFALAQVGSTLVFTWWSIGRSTDPALARLAFDTVAGVGQPIPVVK